MLPDSERISYWRHVHALDEVNLTRHILVEELKFGHKTFPRSALIQPGVAKIKHSETVPRIFSNETFPDQP